MAETTYISSRATSNFVANKLHEIRSYCFYKQYDPETNPDGIIALAIAENKLMRDEITEHINNHFKIRPWHLTYGHGPYGSNELRKTLASFVNEVFHPFSPVEDKHICICNGAGSAVSNLAFCMGEPGDDILVGRPLYVGFFPDIEAHAKIEPVLVSFGEVDPTSASAVAAYEAAIHTSAKEGITIRAILLASPHNPLGRPYTIDFLKSILRLCSKYNIHLISEVYAKSFFPSSDYPSPPPFTSVLSFDLQQYINPALVSIIYGMSKDYCANGIRIGALISPFNPTLMRAFRSITSFTRASQLAEHVWLNLLQDRPFQETYFPVLTRKMTDAYEYTTSMLRSFNIRYNPACVSSFIWIDLSEYLAEDSVDAELALNWRMAKAGVWIAMGASFASERNGNFRITFATPRKELTRGMERLIGVLGEVKEEREWMTGKGSMVEK